MKRTAPELIAAKRDGAALDPDEIRELIAGFVGGDVKNYQMSAFAMAVLFRGMTRDETVALTLAMRDSGVVLDLSDVVGIKVDKHSTGGVGDKVSLCLAPLVAACGVPVPMVSGRGLGHTGGTLDKLEAIPGFRVDLSTARFREVIRDVGTCMIGQTAEIAPADRALYALRDVTATVESIPLIVASILSKKLAEGIDGLVLDVKTGSGAFMKTPERARELASTLVDVARGAGKHCVAWITRMDRPLGRAVGNALETHEALEVLHGRGPDDVVEVTVALGASMLVLGGACSDETAGRTRIREAIADGSGARIARKMIAAQYGDPRVVDDPTVLPRAPTVIAVRAPRDGWIAAVDAHGVGTAAIALGAGRTRTDDVIDPAVGFVFERSTGDKVAQGDVLVNVHAGDEIRAREAVERIERVFTYADSPPVSLPLLIERIG